jgi:hypothetical protein
LSFSASDKVHKATKSKDISENDFENLPHILKRKRDEEHSISSAEKDKKKMKTHHQSKTVKENEDEICKVQIEKIDTVKEREKDVPRTGQQPEVRLERESEKQVEKNVQEEMENKSKNDECVDSSNWNENSTDEEPISKNLESIASTIPIPTSNVPDETSQVRGEDASLLNSSRSGFKEPAIVNSCQIMEEEQPECTSTSVTIEDVHMDVFQEKICQESLALNKLPIDYVSTAELSTPVIESSLPQTSSNSNIERSQSEAG